MDELNLSWEEAKVIYKALKDFNYAGKIDEKTGLLIRKKMDEKHEECFGNSLFDQIYGVWK